MSLLDMGFYDPGVPNLPCNSTCFDLKSIFLGLWETCDTNSPFHVRLKLGSRSKDSFSKIPCTNQIISKSKLITEFHQILSNIYPNFELQYTFSSVTDPSSTLGNPLCQGHQQLHRDGALLFGPYTSVSRIRDL